MPAAIDITGERFGKWTVLSLCERRNSAGHRVFKCRCDCGAEQEVTRANLKSGASSQCMNCRVRHGNARRGKMTGAYVSWHKMMGRCYNRNDDGYHNYGGRGIKVDPRWHLFENFLEDMGERPEGLTLERVHNDVGYGPQNCKWATRKEQAQNRRSKWCM